jgi:PhzF family phenazine biosynthesis protein
MRIFQVDAFTSRRFSGNPATVVLDAAAQSDEQYAQIAREFAHAETAFVLPAIANDHDVGVRFFNSRKEAAFVGHATLAVHHVLLTLGMRDYGEYRQKSRQGVMTVRAERDTERPLFEFRQTAADLDASLGLEAKLRVAHALGLSDELLHKSLPTVVARKGSTRLLLPLISATSLRFIKPDFKALVELGTALGVEGFFPFVVEQDGEAVRTRSRMFCPALGIPEDPVSGNAHAMLATYLWRLTELRPFLTQFTGSQGEYVNRAGTVNVRLEIKDGELIAAHIGGHAVTVSEGRLTENQPQ